MPNISFFVPGVPVPQGSKVYGVRKDGTAYGRESAKGFAPWRRKVREAAEAALMASDEWEAGYDGPVQLVAAFTFPPIAAKRFWKTSAPDIDKCVRLIADALTQAGVYKDDARVVHLEASKIHGTTSGVTIHVGTLDLHPIERANAA